VSSIASGKVDLIQVGLTTALALGFIAVVARWGGAVCSTVARWVGNQLQVGEAEFAMAMVLLFGLVCLSETIGAVAIIGAFLAGMAISKSVPHRVHELSHGVTELLVPFFVAEIGLNFQLKVFEDPHVVGRAFCWYLSPSPQSCLAAFWAQAVMGKRSRSAWVRG